MSRRKRAVKREIIPDPKYSKESVAKFINSLMIQGKKSIAESVLYGAFDIINGKLSIDPLEVFTKAIENVRPLLEVKSRRVGGANYQVPVEIRPNRSTALAYKWIITSSRARSEKTMRERLAAELMDAFGNKGVAVKKREDTHKMAEANRAFAHYRW